MKYNVIFRGAGDKIPLSLQNKENRGLMERLTSEANARAQSIDRVQGLEVQLEKLTNQKASVEARERKAQEDSSLVGLHVQILSSFFYFFSCDDSLKVSMCFLQFQQVAQLQKEVAALLSENQSVKKKFEVSTNEAKGESCTIFDEDFIVTWTQFWNRFLFDRKL